MLGAVHGELDCQIEKQLLGLVVGSKGGNQMETVNGCMVVGASERVQSFLLKNGHLHSVVPP